MGECSQPTEVPVWVENAKKWLTGLTNRTTCDDIIYAILHHDNRHETDNTNSYAIFEQWRNMEKSLQGRTKILKVWKTWGSERGSVQFVMRRIDEVSVSGEFSLARQKHKRRRHRAGSSSRRQVSRHSTAENQRLRDLEKLAKLVIFQEQTLEGLSEQITKTDFRIECFENKFHSYRVLEKGANYVQNSYLGSGNDDGTEVIFSAKDLPILQSYVELCDRVIGMEEKLIKARKKIGALSSEIQISKDAVVGLRSNSPACKFAKNSQFDPVVTGGDGGSAEREIEWLRAEVNRLSSANAMNEVSEKELDMESEHCDRLLKKAKMLVGNLQRELKRTERTFCVSSDLGANCATREAGGGDLGRADVVNKWKYSMEKNGYCGVGSGISNSSHQCKANKSDDTDSTSDTGLSSMHSDEYSAHLETLV